MSGHCNGRCVRFEISETEVVFSFHGKELRIARPTSRDQHSEMKDLCDLMGVTKDVANSKVIDPAELAEFEREIQEQGPFAERPDRIEDPQVCLSYEEEQLALDIGGQFGPADYANGKISLPAQK